MHPAGRRAGFSLMEMTAVMWTLGIAVFVGSALVVAGYRAIGLGETADTRLTQRGELTRQFRYDVARAEAAPDKLGEVAAGPDRFFLKMPGGAVVTYEWAANVLTRTEKAGDRETRRPVPLGSERVRVAFARPKDGVATLQLVETLTTGVERVADVSAALGGDVR